MVNKKRKIKKQLKASIKVKPAKKEVRLDFDFFKWLSLGFSIASVGIGIAILLYILTSLNK